MKFRSLALLALLIATALPSVAAELIGKWTAEFDSQIGVQKYIYEFKQAGEQITGQATYDHSLAKGTVQLRAIKIEGDQVSFSEPLTIEGNEITITYTGTLAGDEIKLTRNVGDFATEQLTAKRAPAAK